MTEDRTILLVDDVEMFRDLGSMFLARTGRVVTASSGEEALSIAKRLRPDVMLVDLLMPGLDGDAVCRFVKSDPDLFKTAVVMLVGVDDPREWGRAVRAGADDVLPKPLSRVSLIETVRRFTRGGKPHGQPRIPVNTTVQLQLGDGSHQAQLRNLSRGGMFLETKQELASEAEIALEFALPESPYSFNPTARVVWKQMDKAVDRTQGIGLRFVDISSDLVRKLEDYVYDRALEPHAISAGAS